MNFKHVVVAVHSSAKPSKINGFEDEPKIVEEISLKKLPYLNHEVILLT